MADGEVRENEYRMRHADGKWRWLQSRETVFSRTATGAVKVVLGTAQDITERRRIERQLQESEARYAGIFHNTADPIFLVGVNTDGTFVYEEFNPPQETITGLSTEEIRDKTPAECFSSETAIHVTERYSAKTSPL